MSRISGYARQRKLHERKRKFPNRQESQVAQAVAKANLDVVQYEYEVQEGDWCAWFDVAVKHMGEMCFIDMQTGRKSGKRDIAVMDRKRDYCKRHSIPMFEVDPGTVLELWGAIEMWKLKRSRHDRGTRIEPTEGTT